MAKTTKDVKKMIQDTVVLQAQTIEWPELVFDVAVESFDDLSFPELRLFLAMLGTPVEEQGALKTKVELGNAIHEAIAYDTVRAQVAYDRIVRQIPEAKAPEPERMNVWSATDFWPTYQRVIDKTRKDLHDQIVAGLVVDATKEVSDLCRSYVDAEMKKVKRLEVVLPSGKVTAKASEVTHAQFEIVLKLVSQGLPVMLVGPTQSGKTTLAKQIAKALNIKFAAQSFSGGLTESKLTGRVLPAKDSGTRFVGTPFLDVFENGGAFLADELDAGDSNVITSLNMGIANGEIWLPERDTKPVALKHAEFRLIAACNTFGYGADARYVGRNALDYATLERFGSGVIYMDYDQRIEASLARPEITAWAWKLRDKIRGAQLLREMSTRTIAVTEQMTKAYGWTPREWNDRFFASWTAEEKRMVA